ncbi:Spy/CpxP family protein refolding chaperone [Flavobacterium adhaerens]|uniref:Spy/CpxP family protein refolding chaperone n=1 Tax=Flavobacterium adhaerens TaxID=3149043 RepID=UPI0032B4E306
MKSQILVNPKNNFKIVGQKLIVAALLVVGVSSFAQDQVQGNKKLDKPKREKMSPEQRNQAQLDRMTKELNLTPQQQEQIKPILAEQSAKMDALRQERMGEKPKKMTAEEREALKAKRQEEKKANDAKLQTILTVEQYKKMKANEAAARDRMRESRDNWGNGDGNRGDDAGGNTDMN